MTLVFLTPERPELQGWTMEARGELERQTTEGLTAAEREQFVAVARKIASNFP